eukprot:jgi/Mesvir1/1977/Mv02168-RA.1
MASVALTHYSARFSRAFRPLSAEERTRFSDTVAPLVSFLGPSGGARVGEFMRPSCACPSCPGKLASIQECPRLASGLLTYAGFEVLKTQDGGYWLDFFPAEPETPALRYVGRVLVATAMRQLDDKWLSNLPLETAADDQSVDMGEPVCSQHTGEPVIDSSTLSVGSTAEGGLPARASKAKKKKKAQQSAEPWVEGHDGGGPGGQPVPRASLGQPLLLAADGVGSFLSQRTVSKSSGVFEGELRMWEAQAPKGMWDPPAGFHLLKPVVVRATSAVTVQEGTRRVMVGLRLHPARAFPVVLERSPRLPGKSRSATEPPPPSEPRFEGDVWDPTPDGYHCPGIGAVRHPKYSVEPDILLWEMARPEGAKQVKGSRSDMIPPVFEAVASVVEQARCGFVDRVKWKVVITRHRCLWAFQGIFPVTRRDENGRVLVRGVLRDCNMDRDTPTQDMRARQQRYEEYLLSLQGAVTQYNW